MLASLLFSVTCHPQIAGFSTLSSVQLQDGEKTLISLSEKYLTLEDLCQRLSLASGRLFTASKNIQQRKVSLFCKNRPLGEVMWAVRQGVGVEWVKATNGSFLLSLSDDQRIRESRAALADQEQARKRINSILSEFVAMSEEPFERLRVRLLRLPEAGAKENRLSMASWVGLGTALSGRESDVSRQLASGSTVYGSTASAVGFLPLPSGFLYKRVFIQKDSGEFAHGSGAHVAFRYELNSNKIEGRAFVTGLDNQPAAVKALDVHLDAEGESETDKSLSQWEQSTDHTVLVRSLDRRREQIQVQSSSRLYGLADYLEQLAAMTDLPVCAESFRRPAGSHPTVEGQTVGEWLVNLNRPRPLPIGYTPVFTRTERGWLLMRHRFSWRMHKNEPPEALVSQMDRKAQDQKLYVEDYARLAGSLSDDQLAAFHSLRPVLCKFPIEPIQHAGEFLAFWNRLTARDQATARGDGLLLPFDSEQAKSRLQWLANQVIWNGRLVRESLLPYFIPLPKSVPAPEKVPGIRLFYRPANFSPTQRPTTSTQSSTAAESGCLFSLGPDLSNSVTVGVRL